MELELKFFASEDYAPILLDKGFKFGKFKHQIDTYYIVDETLKGYRTWLRIREDLVGNTASLDLHRLVSEIATDEKEIGFPAAEVDKMKLVMETLGHNVKCAVNKQRRTFIRDDVKVTLDEIENLGKFIEVEIEGEETESDIAALNAVVAELGLKLSLHINAGYPELLMRKRK